MPLPHFLGLVLAVIALAGMTVWAAAGSGLSFGAVALAALIGGLAIRALAWH